MDSNEVVIIEEKATTNGINGNHEDTSEMKTRSKVADGEDAAAAAAKPKLRSTRTTNVAAAATTAAAAAAAATPKNEDKSGSDSEKKDKKMNLRSGDPEPPTPSKEAKATASAAKKPAAAPDTPAKKKSEREDDSGINSRSSSVSNEETYSSRMRTRSKTAEALTSSTPASTKKSSRTPLSAYDFEDISFDEDASTSNSLKRKAVLYVEEMDEPEDAVEPPAKVSRALPGSSFINAILSPLRAIRGKITVASQTDKVQTNGTDDAASQTLATKIVEDETPKEHVASQTEHEAQQADKGPSTCAIM